jgi:FkbM family methyltransferase
MPPTTGEIERDLIFDVGASNGDDSAYYLHKGFRVVAVEASPPMHATLRERFRREIEDGRLILVAAAIASQEGEAPFWICDDEPGRSSFDRVIASYHGSRHHSVVVPTCSFSSLLERFGTPFYCKIDIEGCDRLCVEQMSRRARPSYLSLELPTIGSAPAEAETAWIMDRLEDLGYDRFKIISQVTYRQAAALLAATKMRMPQKLSLRITLLEQAVRKYRRDEQWVFGDESSGPFGEDTRGKWLSPQKARSLIAIIRRNRDLSDWYDVHAAAGAA